MSRCGWLLAWFLCGVVFAGTPMCALAQNVSSNESSSTPEQLANRAATHERAGQWLAAAEAYKELILSDPTREKVAAQRLVKVYAQVCATNEALHWASEVMKDHPDPQPYLAGVYPMLADYDGASQILVKEIAGAIELRRKLTLRWQLADVYEKHGRPDSEEELLKETVDLAEGSPDEKVAGKRLDRFRERRAKSNNSPPPGKGREEENSGRPVQH